MSGTQCKFCRRGTEKAGKDRRIKKGRFGKGDILYSFEVVFGFARQIGKINMISILL